MRRKRLLDLFCGAGGCADGYDRAGFDVVGVDIEPQPHYPFEFHQADALDVLAWVNTEETYFLTPRTYLRNGFDAIHASPPCQKWTAGAPGRHREDHPDLLTPTRKLLKEIGVPYIIENVPGAPMPDAFLLCGSTFGLPIVRHRLFETNWPIGLVPSLCHQREWGRAVEHGPGFYPYGHGKWRDDWREHVLPEVWPWMTLDEAGQAIPPAYTEFIGSQLMAILDTESQEGER